MTTRQNPMAGRYFNDPNFAAAVSNLASAFAPPSPEEYLTAEKVKGLRTSNAALADAYGLAGNDFDKLGIVADLYDPSQSYYSVDTDAATARRGQDVAAATTLDKARIDGTYGLAGTKLGYDDTMPGLSPEIAAAIGAPAFAPQSGAALGAPAPPMNESELIAKILGEQDPATQRAYIGSKVNPVKIAGPDGPTYADPLSALGQPAYTDPGSQAAADPVMLVDKTTGEQVSGFALPNGGYVLGDGKTPAPSSMVAYKLPQIQGTANDVGLGKATENENDRRFIASAKGMEVVDDAIANFTANPGTQGALGAARRVFNGAMQTLREAGALAEGTEVQDVTSLLEQGLIDEAVASRLDPAYNPALTEAQILGNMVVWAYASAQQGDARVSNQQLDEAMAALGLSGVFATNADAITAAQRVREMLQRDYNSTASLANPALVKAYSSEVRKGTAPPPAVTPPATGATTTPGQGLSPEALKWIEGP